MLPMPQIILSAVSVSPTLIWCIIGIAVFLLLYMACGYVKAPPNKAYIVSGLRKKKKILIGRAGFRMPLIERIDKLSLDVMQVDVKTSEAVPTNEFINVTVDGVANIKISSNPELLEKAAEALLGMDKKQLIFLVTQVLEGNMREIVGSVGLKEMVQERQVVAEKIKENAVPDMQKLGIEIVNFNIQNFKDGAGTIENMGIDNVEQIRKAAQIAKAEAARDIAIAEANAKEEANKIAVAAHQRIAEQNTSLSIREAELKKDADVKRAEADAAYEIQKEEQRKTIEVTSANADIARREKEAELAEKEIALQEEAGRRHQEEGGRAEVRGGKEGGSRSCTPPEGIRGAALRGGAGGTCPHEGGGSRAVRAGAPCRGTACACRGVCLCQDEGSGRYPCRRSCRSRGYRKEGGSPEEDGRGVGSGNVPDRAA